jgi:hypothetical protein
MAFNYSPKVVTNGLVLYLDAANTKSYVSGSTTWSDISRSGTNGTLVNGPGYSSTNSGNITFDGVDDYCNCGTFTGLGSIDRSINIWFKIISLGANKKIVNFAANDLATDTPNIQIAFDTTLSSLRVGMGGTPYDCYTTLSSFTLDTWINISLSITSNVMSIYRNGAYISQKANTGTVALNPIIYIGRYNANYGQYGNINVGNMQVYNRALTAQEVLQNYNATRTRFGL